MKITVELSTKEVSELTERFRDEMAVVGVMQAMSERNKEATKAMVGNSLYNNLRFEQDLSGISRGELLSLQSTLESASDRLDNVIGVHTTFKK